MKCFGSDVYEHYYDNSLDMFVLHFSQNVSDSILLRKRLVKANEFYELRLPRIVSNISEVRCDLKMLYVCSYLDSKKIMYGDGNNLYECFARCKNLVWSNGMVMPNDIWGVLPYAFECKTIMFDALPKTTCYIGKDAFLNSKFMKSFNIHDALKGFNYAHSAFSGSNLKILCITAVEFPYLNKIVAALHGCLTLEIIFVDDSDNNSVALSNDVDISFPGVNIIYYSQILNVDENGVIVKDK